MNIFYRELERVREYFVRIDNYCCQLKTRQTTGTAQGEGKVKQGNCLKSHEIIPVSFDPFQSYNYVQINESDIPKNMIPISWHELPYPVKQQIVQIEENEKIGIYDPQRPSILFTG